MSDGRRASLAKAENCLHYIRIIRLNWHFFAGNLGRYLVCIYAAGAQNGVGKACLGIVLRICSTALTTWSLGDS